MSRRRLTLSDGRVTGRLVYDLDESETIETLDAPSQGVDYTWTDVERVDVDLPPAMDPPLGGR